MKKQSKTQAQAPAAKTRAWYDPPAKKAKKAKAAPVAITGDEPVLVEAKEEVAGFEVPEQKENTVELVEVKSPKANGSMAATLRAHRKSYVAVTEVVDGKKVRRVSCGDEVAAQLRELNVTQIASWCAELCGESAGFWLEKYGHLNPGQVRMNLGNKIRAALKKACAIENREVVQAS